jgi:hypothetical protein
MLQCGMADSAAGAAQHQGIIEETIMAEQQAPEAKAADPVEMSRSMAKIAERSQRLVSEFLERQQRGAGRREIDPLNIGGAFMEMTAQMMADPAKLVQGGSRPHGACWARSRSRSSSPKPATGASAMPTGTRATCSTSSSSPIC